VGEFALVGEAGGRRELSMHLISPATLKTLYSGTESLPVDGRMTRV